MIDTLEPARAPDAVKEPAKAWVNWFRAKRVVFSKCLQCGQAKTYRVGDVWGGGECHFPVYPSADVAETVGRRESATCPLVDWVCSLPEGERP